MSNADPDILVIGAGLTGAMIAAHIAEGGARVAVIDAQQVGQSATRRALGLATLNPHPAHLDETARGIELLKHIAARHGVMLQSCNTLHLASTPQRRQVLRDIAQAKPDTHIEWTEQTDMLPAGLDVDGALIVHDSALADVERLVMRLLQQSDIIVRQYAEAFKLELHRGTTYALCKDYTVPARCVVLATNAYAGLLSPYLAESVQAARGAIWTSHPMRDRVEAASNPLLNTPVVIDDARLTITPGKDARLQAAAWLWNGQANEPDADPSNELHRFLKKLDAGLLEQTEQWITGVTTSTADGAPLVGKLDTDGNVLYAIGLGPYGLAWAPIVAEKIAGLALAQ